MVSVLASFRHPSLRDRDPPPRQRGARLRLPARRDAGAVYDGEDAEEAQLAGPGPCIHHWGIEVEDRDAYAAKIEANGGTIISHPAGGALKFRAPDGTVAEIAAAGRYKWAAIHN